MTGSSEEAKFWSFGPAVPFELSQPATVSESWKPGEVVAGRYRIEAAVGRGAQATVYRAQDLRVLRRVALKALGSLDDDERARFQREGQLLARLWHVGLVRVHGIEEHEGVPILVMEFVEGATLEDRLDELGRDEGLRILEDVARGLGEAHRLGVVHRDVKPRNVLLGAEGPRLADFGLARGPDRRRLTQTGALLGTPLYMAPEQLRGEVAGPQADVWALGVILFRLLARRFPFDAPNVVTQLQLASSGAPRFRALGVRASAELEAVCARALAPDPALRFPDAAAFASALRTAAASPSESPPQPAVWGGLVLVAVAIGVTLAATRALVAPNDGRPVRRASVESPPEGVTLLASDPLGPARVELYAERLQQALELLEPLLERRPDLVEGWQMRGLALRWLGDLRAAESSLTRALELDPQHVQAREHRALTRRVLVKLAESEADRRVLRDLADENPAAWSALGRLHRAWGRPEAARALLDEAIAQGVDEAAVLFERAMVRLGAGDTAGATQDVLEAAGHASVEPAWTWLCLGAALAGQKQWGLALPALDRGLAMFPDHATSLMLRGRCHEELGQPALEQYDLALALEPDHVPALLSRGRVLLGKGDPAGALVDLERLWSLGAGESRDWARPLLFDARQALGETGPDDAEALRLWRACEAAQQRGDLAQARALIESLLEMSPTDSEAWTKHGYVLFGLGDPGAETSLNRALELDPGQQDARGLRAELRFFSGRPGEALEDYEWLVERHPRTVEVWRGMSLAYQHLRRFQQALSAADRAIGLSVSGDGKDFALRALARSALGDRDGALSDASQALMRARSEEWALKSSQSTTKRLAAEALLSAGHLEAALAALDSLPESDRDARSLALRGECRRRLGQAGAEDDLERALKLDPKSAIARCFRGSLRLEQGRLEEALADLELAVREPTWFVAEQAQRDLQRVRRQLD